MLHLAIIVICYGLLCFSLGCYCGLPAKWVKR